VSNPLQQPKGARPISVAERRAKTGFLASIPTVHFSVGVAHWVYDDFTEDEGYWTTPSNQWSVNGENRHITSDDLLASILHHASCQTRRANVKKWLQCDSGDWGLDHTNPAKGQPRDILTWDEPTLLSAVIDSGPYEQKLVQGTVRKLVTIWLYWTPEPPLALTEPTTPTPRRYTKKARKKEKGIKAEKGIKPEVEPCGPVVAKRPHPTSAEMSTANRPGTVTRRQARVLEEAVSAEEEEEGSELPTLTEILKRAEVMASKLARIRRTAK